jgi:hypothetical protein
MSGIVNNKHYSDENKKRIAHNLEDILIDCKFNYQKCSASDFVWHFDPLFGNCYVFNSGYNSTGDPIELKQSSVAGVLFGLQVILYLNYNENLTFINSKPSKASRPGLLDLLYDAALRPTSLQIHAQQYLN